MTSTLIIIPAAYRDPVNALIASHPAFPKSRVQEFDVPLYPVGDELQEAPTHYWLAHRFTKGQRSTLALLHNQFPEAGIFDYDLQNEPGFPQTKLEELGLTTRTSQML